MEKEKIPFFVRPLHFISTFCSLLQVITEGSDYSFLKLLRWKVRFPRCNREGKLGESQTGWESGFREKNQLILTDKTLKKLQQELPKLHNNLPFPICSVQGVERTGQDCQDLLLQVRNTSEVCSNLAFFQKPLAPDSHHH